MDMSKDTLFRGEFDVVKDLIASFEDGEAAKRMCDKVEATQIIWDTLSPLCHILLF